MQELCSPARAMLCENGKFVASGREQADAYLFTEPGDLFNPHFVEILEHSSAFVKKLARIVGADALSRTSCAAICDAWCTT
jgi:hypothetical protein